MIIPAKRADVAFRGFPADPILYTEDVAPIVQSTIQRHGLNEWRAVVLTHELHGHLGIYSLLGVKMGIRATEEFGERENPLEVISYAGDRPPISCLNDGLQVATGATLGHGLIRLHPSDTPLPEADFRAPGKAIHIRLGEEWHEKLRREIADGVVRFGSQTPEYWNFIRSRAIHYWYAWDRHRIFEVSKG